MKTISIRRPDDFHVHLRQGAMLAKVLPATARRFGRALVMPNTRPPTATAEDVSRYREEILTAASARNLRFEPLMTVMLTPATTPQTIFAAKDAGAIAAKLYPQGVTTNSSDGVKSVGALAPVFAAMERCGMALCLHGETPDVFCLDREEAFLPELRAIAREFPRLRIVLEHLSTASAVACVEALPDTVAATITVHHLRLTLDDVVGNLLSPHHFCKPIAKRPHDREALVAAALGGNPKFFLGTDSAPHPQEVKECHAGCAGVFSAPVALESLADLFDRLDALDRLEDFTSSFGSRFYGLPLNEGTVELKRESWQVPMDSLEWWGLVPFHAGDTLRWRLAP